MCAYKNERNTVIWCLVNMKLDKWNMRQQWDSLLIYICIFFIAYVVRRWGMPQSLLLKTIFVRNKPEARKFLHKVAAIVKSERSTFAGRLRTARTNKYMYGWISGPTRYCRLNNLDQRTIGFIIASYFGF